MELCTILIKRWRPETNTFHMYQGKMTITLGDVSFMSGLPVDEGAVFEESPTKNYDGDRLYSAYWERRQTKTTTRRTGD
ncbi:Serine/threonine-protein phosphatase 7 long form homolog [Linum grandiflorum]